MGARSLLRSARVAAVLLVCGTVFEGAQPARAAAVTELAGIQGSAAASGFYVFYGPSGVLPVPELLALSAPDALATISSGPSTFARAAVADPGDLLVNPDALLAVAASPSYQAGTLPPYPYRVSASSASGQPEAASIPAPGLEARVSARPGGSSAAARFPAFDAAALVNVGSVSANATTSTEGSSVTVRAVTKLSDIDLLGLLRIESLVTDLTATSDGNETKLTGGTEALGATLLGQPVTIDGDGIHIQPNGSGSPLAGLTSTVAGSVNDLLRDAGITVSLVGPVRLGEGRIGQLASTGLRIDLDVTSDMLPGLDELIGLLPPIDNPIPGIPGIEDVLQIVQANHLATVELGRGMVSLAASGSEPADDVAVPSVPSVDLPGGFGTPAAVDLPTLAPSAVDPDARGAVAASRGLSGEGIAGIALLLLLTLPLMGDRLAAAARVVLAVGDPDHCDAEVP